MLISAPHSKCSFLLLSVGPPTKPHPLRLPALPLPVFLATPHYCSNKGGHFHFVIMVTALLGCADVIRSLILIDCSPFIRLSGPIRLFYICNQNHVHIQAHRALVYSILSVSMSLLLLERQKKQSLNY